MLSALVGVRVDGDRPLDDAELASTLWNLIGGGLDTTTSLTALSMHHLDAHPELRRQLLDDPRVLNTATEEFLRYFSVNEMLSRTVTVDTELGGTQLRRGDQLLISWLSANLDETQFPDADTVRFDRSSNPHLAFGVGPHRCIGMHLARTLFQVMMTAILKRMGDFRVDRAATRFYQGNPELFGVVTMPMTYSPGAALGAPSPF
jgi:cytochrome P450